MPHGETPRHVRRKKPAGKRRRSAPVKGKAPLETVPLSGLLRLQKVLAAAGVASRRAAEELIRAGRVSVNGETAEIGVSVDPAVDVVRVDGEKIRAEKPRYWVLHKPKGVLTTLADPHGRRTVRDLIPGSAGRVHPVGRLDFDSSGLVLLTNDGVLTQKLLHPSRESEKEYRVTFKGEMTDRDLKRLRQGVHLDDGPSKPIRVEGLRFDTDRELSSCQLTLTEGRKRQIRRMLLRVGHPVKKLVRIRMGPIRLGRLGVGLARALRADEVRSLRRYVESLDESEGSERKASNRSRSVSGKAKRSPRVKAAGRKKPAKSRA
ncbi:MAG: pseudouridine synthase [Myxococcota bacterium]|nr:pseudouridine synthase [Myxococcota bacterium]